MQIVKYIKITIKIKIRRKIHNSKIDIRIFITNIYNSKPQINYNKNNSIKINKIF